MISHRGNPEDRTEAYYRGLMHSVGYRRKDLDKPQIGVEPSMLVHRGPCVGHICPEAMSC